MFNRDDKYFLKVNSVDAVHDMQSYLNNWNQIQDFASVQQEQRANSVEEPINSKNDTLLTFVDLKRFLLSDSFYKRWSLRKHLVHLGQSMKTLNNVSKEIISLLGVYN